MTIVELIARPIDRIVAEFHMMMKRGPYGVEANISQPTISAEIVENNPERTFQKMLSRLL